MIIQMHKLLEDAKKRKYGIAAPNVFNRETIEAAFEAGRILRSPVILDVHPTHGIYECADIARFFEKRYPEVPVALNLDHGSEYKLIVSAIQAGFSSVMVDSSTLPYEENIKEVKEIVKIAHSLDISVEAELGHVGQADKYTETRDAGLTRPDEAVSYVKDTKVDCLAVAVGTSHGIYKGTPKIDFKLLKILSARISIPLVLHGGSNTGDDNLCNAIKCGIQKINLATDLNTAGLKCIKKAGDNNFLKEFPGKTKDETVTKRMNLQQLIMEGVKGYQKQLMYYMNLFNSSNKF